MYQFVTSWSHNQFSFVTLFGNKYELKNIKPSNKLKSVLVRIYKLSLL